MNTKCSVVNILTITLLFIISFIALIYVSEANVDLSEGRFALFMDERITFDGVKKILHPANFGEFYWAVTDGNDHRYGRSLWNASSLVSFLPEQVWGDKGQIIATRTLGVLLTIGSSCVLAFGLLRTPLLRLLLLLIALTLPFASYYMTMPKPEPLQLFFISLFIYYYAVNESRFGKYWFFAGLAFGTKISVLPPLLVFALASLYQAKGNQIALTIRAVISSFIYFCLGLGLAVPILLPAILVAFAGAYAIYRTQINKEKYRYYFISGLTFFWALLVFIYFKKPFSMWASQTFLNTSHGADNAAIGILEWINYFFQTWMSAPRYIGLFWVLVLLAYLLYQFVLAIKDRGVSNRGCVGLIVACAGLALDCAIFISTKRLWGFYLYTGTLLSLIGIVLLLDEDFSEKRRFTSGVVVTVMLTVAIVFWLPNTLLELDGLSKRTKSREYIIQHESYKKYMTYLERRHLEIGKRLEVMFSPSNFPPDKSDNYEIVEFWGPYKWNKVSDVLIFNIYRTPRSHLPDKDSINYLALIAERKGYELHTVKDGKSCLEEPCYKKVFELPNGGEVLELIGSKK